MSTPTITLPPYLGQRRLARIVADYLGEEEDLLQKKDLVNRAFTEANAYTAALSTPSKVFCGLGPHWWRQIIDGKYSHSPLVFDEGSHGGVKEPGYYEGIWKASCFVCHLLAQKPTALHDLVGLTVPEYCRIHQIACSHFAGEKTNTFMMAKDAGKFSKAGFCRVPLSELYTTTPEQMIDLRKNRELLLMGCKDARAAAQDRISKFNMETKRRIDRVNHYIARRSKALDVEPIASLVREDDQVFVYYHGESTKAEETLIRLFREFQVKMAAAESSDQKIRWIADLFQVLEWLHPFLDGQGRTDLIVLSKELVAAGLNPPILEEPYFSTLRCLDEWVIYLKQGIERWQKEFSANRVRILYAPPKNGRPS